MTYTPFTKLIIKTDIRGSDLERGIDDEDMQILSIGIDGDISLISYTYDYRETDFVIKDQYAYKIDPDRTSSLLGILDSYFMANLDLPVIKDGPHFILEFYFEDTSDILSYRFNLLEDYEMSIIVRQFLLNYDLFVFDGKKNYDHIEKIILNYQRTIRLVSDEEISYKGIREDLTIDKETVTIKRYLEDGTTVDFSCKIPDKLADFLGYLENAEIFYYIDKTEEELFYDPNDKNHYDLTLIYEKKGTLITDGTYDKRNLPYFFNVFITNLTDILAKSSIPDILDPSIYSKMVRSESDYIYLSVEFSPDSDSYYYRTEDDGISVGDRVIVPVGNKGREKIAEVVDKEYFAYENVPFPLEETKIIIGKIVE